MSHCIKVLHIGKKGVWIEVAGYRIAGVYRQGNGGTKDIEDWLAVCGRIKDTSKPCLALGDWNSHHASWSLDGKGDARGRYLKEGMEELGLTLDTKSSGATFRCGDFQQSRIDLVLRSEEIAWEDSSKRWLLSDHYIITGTIKLREDLPPPPPREIIDIKAIGLIFDSMSKVSESEQEEWYEGLEGDSAYNKLMGLVASCRRLFRHHERSKRWWDLELADQLKRVRKAARGGIGAGARSHNQDRWKCWKLEKTKMKQLIRRKKTECWQKFLGEYGQKDPWEVVRLAKNPWGSQG